MRPKVLRIRFLPVNDCAIVAPGADGVRPCSSSCVHPRLRRRAIGPSRPDGRWKGPAFAGRPFALVGGRRTAPRGRSTATQKRLASHANLFREGGEIENFSVDVKG